MWDGGGDLPPVAIKRRRAAEGLQGVDASSARADWPSTSDAAPGGAYPGADPASLKASLAWTGKPLAGGAGAQLGGDRGRHGRSGAIPPSPLAALGGGLPSTPPSSPGAGAPDPAAETAASRARRLLALASTFRRAATIAAALGGVADAAVCAARRAVVAAVRADPGAADRGWCVLAYGDAPSLALHPALTCPGGAPTAPPPGEEAAGLAEVAIRALDARRGLGGGGDALIMRVRPPPPPPAAAAAAAAAAHRRRRRLPATDDADADADAEIGRASCRERV